MYQIIKYLKMLLSEFKTILKLTNNPTNITRIVSTIAG